MACERTSETIKIESLKIHAKKKLVNGQDVFLFQPTGLEKFESVVASGNSDNQSTKTKHYHMGLKRPNSQLNT